MKTILVVDGAENCAYDCFLMSERLFELVFPGEGQDVEFYEDVERRFSGGALDEEFSAMWGRRVSKKNINGIDGTLFYGLQSKKKYYPNKRDADLDGVGRAP